MAKTKTKEYSSEILREAIIDAKAVREAALKAAENALAEQFTPHLQEMLNKQIEQELSDEDIDLSENAEDEDESENLLFESEDNETVETVDEQEADDEDDEDKDDDDDDEIEETVLEMDLDSELEDELEDEGDEFELEDDAVELHTESEDSEEEITLDELIEALNELAESEEDEDDAVDIEETSELEEENKRLKTELQEALEVVQELSSNNRELNLLNAKLLYTNRIFKKYPLDYKGKIAVVENFDKASTVKEAKLVYSTLVESLDIKSKKSKTKNLTESLMSGASKSMESTAPKKEVIDNGDWQVSRIQKIAGIIK